MLGCANLGGNMYFGTFIGLCILASAVFLALFYGMFHSERFRKWGVLIILGGLYLVFDSVEFTPNRADPLMKISQKNPLIPAIIPANVAVSIRNHCIGAWPNSFVLQKYCIETQSEAYIDLHQPNVSMADIATIKSNCFIRFEKDVLHQKKCIVDGIESLENGLR